MPTKASNSKHSSKLSFGMYFNKFTLRLTPRPFACIVCQLVWRGGGRAQWIVFAYLTQRPRRARAPGLGISKLFILRRYALMRPSGPSNQFSLEYVSLCGEKASKKIQTVLRSLLSPDFKWWKKLLWKLLDKHNLFFPLFISERSL